MPILLQPGVLVRRGTAIVFSILGILPVCTPPGEPPVSLVSDVVGISRRVHERMGAGVVSSPKGFEALLGHTADSLAPVVASARSAEEKVGVLKRQVYDRWAITFDPDRDNVTGMLPHSTLRENRGSCLGVSLLFLLLAEKLNLPLYGVLLPTHFFVRYDDGAVRINIEPNGRGKRYTDREYRRKYGVEPGSRYDLRNLSDRETIAVLRFNLGNAYRARNMLKQASEEYRKVVGVLPGFAEAWGNLAIARDLSGDTREAIRLLRKARSLNPGLSNIDLNLGTLLLKAGQPESAAEAYRRATRRSTDTAEPWYGLALAFSAMGRPDSTLRFLDSTLARDPRHEDALALRRKLLSGTRELNHP